MAELTVQMLFPVELDGGPTQRGLCAAPEGFIGVEQSGFAAERVVMLGDRGDGAVLLHHPDRPVPGLRWLLAVGSGAQDLESPQGGWFFGGHADAGVEVAVEAGLELGAAVINGLEAVKSPLTFRDLGVRGGEVRFEFSDVTPGAGHLSGGFMVVVLELVAPSRGERVPR